MPQELSTTSLIGQEQTTSTGLGAVQLGDALPAVYEFGGIVPLGASQDPPSSETAKFSEKPLAQVAHIPSGFKLLPPLKVLIRRGSSTLQTRQLWEGTVTEVRNGKFVAVLNDKTNPDNPDEYAVFEYDEVSPEDRRLVGTGAAFYWIIGSERTVGGQVKNVSIVQFRRVPAWTRSALAQAAERAQRVREVFRAQE